ncbi:CBP80/20-dependent translation initiation factor [Cylas formicarius]|uniref:CBP80/20-dependent translation initiation factor n=1 Tax=Cylas formicarius TaxID=197179 RepID=UPI00295843DB|nr:CBP80/20-dependent translation initiation factor [Cylas formicarius]
MLHAPELKRSQRSNISINKSTNPVLTRERSFVKPNKDAMKRRSHTMATIKAGKPTMEIYRPPNVRTDLPNVPGKLNVHAKEFTMNEINPSKSSGNVNAAVMGFQPVPLQHSKSSGNILRHPGFVPLLAHGMPIPLLHSASAAHIVSAMSSSNFQYPAELLPHSVFTGANQQPIYRQSNWIYGNSQPHQIAQHGPQSLKRSKSVGAAAGDAQTLANKLKDLVSTEEIDFSVFSEPQRADVKQAVTDANKLSSRMLMDVVKIVMEKVVEGIKYSESISKLCIAIIKEEKNQTFLESLLNTCQQWYQERDKILRGIKAGDGTRFTAFMWFLTELYGQLKRQQIKDSTESLQPELVLLSVLAKCCRACVAQPIRCATETECLFFVLTSIGRDMEVEIPQMMEELLTGVRDGFLSGNCSSSVRRTLLQLIELHASNWQLPGSSVLYYYPRIK